MDRADLYRRLDAEICRAERAVAVAQRLIAQASALRVVRSESLRRRLEETPS